MDSTEKLMKRLERTIKQVAKTVSISPSELTRDIYTRISVDLGLKGRLNKEELNDIGGYTTAKDTLFPKVHQRQIKPKILVYDIETSPIEAYVWSIWNVNVGLNQIIKDWSILSWSAKWVGAPEDEIFYMDTRNKKDPRDDKEVVQGLRDMLDEADIVLTQNGKKFDQKKLNTRCLVHGIKPPSSYRHIDTRQIAKKTFSFTSNKLAYMTDLLCDKNKKYSHGKFPGQDLWTECLKGNKEAWEEMEKYNKIDILSLEELYLKMAPWDNSINFGVYGLEDAKCKCGNDKFEFSGYHYTNSGKYEKYRCTECGFEERDTENLLSKERRKRLLRRITPSH